MEVVKESIGAGGVEEEMGGMVTERICRTESGKGQHTGRMETLREMLLGACEGKMEIVLGGCKETGWGGEWEETIGGAGLGELGYWTWS